MRTTLNLDEDLIKDLMAVTEARTKVEAIHLAVSEFVRRRKLEGLKALSGKVHIAENWQEIEEMELRELEQQKEGWGGHR
jgi:hypothetical protein